MRHFGKKKTLNILGSNQSRKKKDKANRQNMFCLRCEIKCKLKKNFYEVFSTNQKRGDEALWKKENCKYLETKPVKKKKMK